MVCVGICISWPFGIFSAIWYNLSPFVINCGHSVYFSHFGMFGPRKIWQPWCQLRIFLWKKIDMLRIILITVLEALYQYCKSLYHLYQYCKSLYHLYQYCNSLYHLYQYCKSYVEIVKAEKGKKTSSWCRLSSVVRSYASYDVSNTVTDSTIVYEIRAAAQKLRK
jgi:hypothetical protein